jgi:LL-diaminopimelate aminotransferase
MNLARRIEKLPPYLFAEISKKVAEKRAQGVDVISFGIGDPDLPTPAHLISALTEAARDPVNHRYPESEGLPELRESIARWYGRRFGVDLDPEKEVLPLIGSKEGIGHIALCFIDAGDVALVPDPGYPVYSVGTLLAGGEPYFIPLTEENDFLPDLDAVPADVARKARVLWLNYPNNPTGAVADLAFFERAVAFAKRNDIAILHDGPYSEVAFDGYRPVSFLQAPGAMDVGIEFHSLSKSYNMTGWRIGMAAGNAQIIDALMRVKSNLDSGIPQAI